MRPSYWELERENRKLKREIQELQAQLKEAQARIAVPEAELRRGRRQAAPFSRDEPKAKPKRPGRRPGQGQFSYRQPPSEGEIQETIEVPLPRCPDCGGSLVDRAPTSRSRSTYRR